MPTKPTLRALLQAAAIAIPAFVLAPRAARAQAPTDTYLGMEGHILDAGNIQLPYRLARPASYDANKKYPLVVFLHGSGESGTDNKLQIQKNIGVPTGGSVFTLPANQAKFPSFFVAPQAPVPSKQGWEGVPGQAVLKLITALEQQFSSIDPHRLYITGLSMGGYGTWALIEDNPKLFACAVPMSGGGDPTKAVNIAAMPIWDFHGTIDPTVPVKESRDMIDALKAAGGMPKYTEYPNGQHAIWDQAYTEPELLPWMFGQQTTTVDADGGLVDGALGIDAPTAVGNESGASGADAASPVEGTPTAGDGGAVVAGEDAGAPLDAAGDDQASGCSCRTARTSSTSLEGYACLVAFGLSIKLRRRTSVAGARR